MDRRPDRVPRLLAARGVVSVANRCACVQRDASAHVLDGDDHLQLHRLAMPGVHDRDRTFDAVDRAAQEPGDLLERPLRGGQPDPLRRLFAELLQPLEREREVSPALGRRHRVDLVHDDGPDASERLPRGGRQHQIEGLGRRDQDVGRAPDHALAIARRACRRCGSRPSARAPAACRADPPHAGSPRGARGDSSRCRRPAREAATRRGPSSSPSGRRAANSEDNRSIAHRKAASVFPEPVGARINEWSPAAIAFHPSRWARVGASKEVPNQSRTAGEKTSRATTTTLPAVPDTREGAGRMPPHASSSRPPALGVRHPDRARGGPGTRHARQPLGDRSGGSDRVRRVGHGVSRTAGRRGRRLLRSRDGERGRRPGTWSSSKDRSR